MKLTKKCIYPWSFMQVHGGGMMQPCWGCDTDMGDFVIDYLEDGQEENSKDVFDNEGLQKLKKGLLTGDLRKMCQECCFTSNKLITTEEFEKTLKEYLHDKNPELDIDHIDLSKTYAYDWMAISFTNRCNLSCVYCVQSTLKETNPYLKMEIPYEYTERTLDLFASKGIRRLSTTVEGEATLYADWYKVFSEFHEKYPDIDLFMTTNLNRKYSDSEIELLTKYKALDVSIDSMKPALYRKIRRNGSLELVLENLNRIDKKANELGVSSNILLHVVVTDVTWREVEEIADFAFQKGYGVLLGNYEERVNSFAYQTNMLKPLSQMPIEIQKEARDTFYYLKQKAESMGLNFTFQADFFEVIDKNVEKDYSRFHAYDDNAIIAAFDNKYPKGLPEMHLDVVYDEENISHTGILFKRGSRLELSIKGEHEAFIIREIKIYKEGTYSSQYKRNILQGYRKKYTLKEGIFIYEPNFTEENVDRILLEILECRVR